MGVAGLVVLDDFLTVCGDRDRTRCLQLSVAHPFLFIAALVNLASREGVVRAALCSVFFAVEHERVLLAHGSFVRYVQTVPGCPTIERCGGKRLRKQYEQLNVVERRRDGDRLRDELFDLAEGKVEDGIRTARRGQPIRVDGRQRQKEWLRRRRAAGQ